MSSQELNNLAETIYQSDFAWTGVNPGQTVRTNHGPCCPAGFESRGRLYFTRQAKPANVVVWYCHNCQEGGAFKLKGRTTISEPVVWELPKDNSEYIAEVYQRCISINDKEEAREFMSKVAHKWLFPNEQCYASGFVGWDDVEQAVVFYIWEDMDDMNSSAVPKAIQHRYFREHGPKCITTKGDIEKVRTVFGCVPYQVVVVVEDPISMHHVYGANWGVNPYCLYGANMDITELLYLKNRGCTKVVVWLDNDNEQVLKNSHLIAQRARGLGMEAVQVLDLPEPKRCPQDILDNELGKHA